MVGRSFDDNDDKQQECARFVCSLYGTSGEDTDSLRFKHWMDQQPAPKALLQLLSCSDKKDHCLCRRCLCHRNDMSYTDAWGCKDCLSHTKIHGQVTGLAEYSYLWIRLFSSRLFSHLTKMTGTSPFPMCIIGSVIFINKQIMFERILYLVYNIL